MATPSRTWSTNGFLAQGSSNTATYLVPGGPAGRLLQLRSQGGGEVVATGCGLDHLALAGAAAIQATGCTLELSLSGAGPTSFTLSTEVQ